MSAEEDPRERRGTGRHEGEFPCQLVIDDIEYEGITRNLSMGGVLIDLPEAAEAGLIDQSGFMTVVINSIPYDCACTVVHLVSTGVGIQFDGIEGSALEKAIFDFINDELEHL